MTKDTYFEMCEMLGNEPIESEVPVEFEDFPSEVQEAFNFYGKLRDDWDGMNGVYMGKHLEGIRDLFLIEDVPAEDHKTMLGLVTMIDKHRSKSIADNKPKDKSKKPPS